MQPQKKERNKCLSKIYVIKISNIKDKNKKKIKKN